MKAVAPIVAALLCTGCVITPGSERVNGFYFGLVRVQSTPEQADDARVVRVSTLGAWREAASSGPGESAGIGWRQTQIVSVPRDCRTVIIADRRITDPRVFNQIQKIASEGGHACIAQKPG